MENVRSNTLNFKTYLCLFLKFNSIFQCMLENGNWTTLNLNEISNDFIITDRNCNPGFLLGIGGAKDKSKVTFDSESIVGLAIWMCCVLYSSLRTASKSSKITMSDHVLVKDTGAGEETLVYWFNIWNNEKLMGSKKKKDSSN